MTVEALEESQELAENFLSCLRDFEDPDIAVSPKGYVIYEWFDDDDNSLVIMFTKSAAIVSYRYQDDYVENVYGDIEDLAEFIEELPEQPLYWGNENTLDKWGEGW